MANPIFRNQRVSNNFDKLYSYISQRCKELQDRRTRYELIDRELERENDRGERQKALVRLNAQGQKSKMRDITVPVLLPAYEAALAHMEGVFLSGYPIFSVVAQRKEEQFAAIMHGLIGRDQQYFGWERQIRMALASGLRYDLLGLETLWSTETASRIITENTAGSPNSGKVEEIQYSGNKMKALDMYNTFYDTSVAPGDVATDGDFVGYIQRKTHAQLKSYLHSMNDSFKNTAVLQEVFASASNQGSILLNSSNQTALNYFEPDVRIEAKGSDPADFRTFFDTPEGKNGEVGGLYDHVVAYVRLIPKALGIIAPRAGSVHIYRIEWVNGRCVYVQPLPDAHGRFPIVLASLVEDGRGTYKKSFCENLIEFQDIATSLHKARMDSLRRSLSDRGLFDPTRIREQDINSENPAAKIPVKMNALNRDLSSAYFPIPYRDEMGGSYGAEIAQQLAMADRASGLNQAMQGNFVRGNKTFQEFDRVMGGSEAKLELKAKMIESQLMVQTKYIIRSNYLQYAVTESVYDRVSKQEVQVDPVELRKREVMFTMTDGALPASKIMNPELVNAAVTGLTQVSAQLGQAPMYDVVGMLVSVLKSAGFHNLEDYKLEQQNGTASPGAAGGTSTPPDAAASAGA